MDKQKIKLEIQKKLNDMIFPTFMVDETIYANKVLQELESKLWKIVI